MNLTGSTPPLSLTSPSHLPHASSEPHADIRSAGPAFEAKQSPSEDDAHLSEARGPKPPSIPATIAQDPTLTFSYSPQQLLNPKGFDAKKAPDTSSNLVKSTFNTDPANPPADVSFTFDTGVNESTDDEDQDAEPPQNGLRSMIERTHNVSEREVRPSKRIKVEHDPEDGDAPGSKSKFTGGAKGSELGQYVRNGRKEGAQATGPPSTSSIVDLTTGLSSLPLQFHRQC